MKHVIQLMLVLGCLWGAGARAAEPAGWTTSGWSSPSSNLIMRISGPCAITVHPDTRDFYLKCEIRNIGAEPVPVYQDARIYLVDASNQTHRSLRYTDGVRYTPILGPGESTAWWQNGKIPQTGDFQAVARLEGDDNLRSPTIPLTLSHSTLTEEQRNALRDRTLQEHFANFQVLEPNTDIQSVTYTPVAFTNDPLVVGGLLYHAFRFTTPEQPSDLVWSFVLENAAHNRVNFNILAEHGDMQGFTYFHSRKFHNDIPPVGKTGDRVLFQRLDRSFLVPGQSYLIWFQSMYRDVPAVTLSLNLLAEKRSEREVFIGIYDKVR
jgi:hypothetical protein